MALPGVYKFITDQWNGQTYHIFSDPHFGDEDLRAGMPGRPSDEELLASINKKIGKQDIVFCLGDVGDIEFAKRIRGKVKILVCGNHDAGASNYEEAFDYVFTGPFMIGEKLILSHEPVETPWALNIHGHDHTGAKRKGHINVCLDANNYEPINMNQLLKSGIFKDVESIHRTTIDKATVRAKKRGKKLGR